MFFIADLYLYKKGCLLLFFTIQINKKKKKSFAYFESFYFLALNLTSEVILELRKYKALASRSGLEFCLFGSSSTSEAGGEISKLSKLGFFNSKLRLKNPHQ